MVLAVSLPFLLVRRADGTKLTLDLRRVVLAPLSHEFVVALKAKRRGGKGAKKAEAIKPSSESADPYYRALLNNSIFGSSIFGTCKLDDDDRDDE